MPSKRSRDDLLQHLDEQLGFIRASAQAYDQGYEGEARRLATSIRVLVHDTRRSHSLLGLLGIKHRIRWIDTADAINPANLLPTNGLTVAHVTAGGGQQAQARYTAPLGDVPTDRARRRPGPFEPWWTRPVTKDERGNLFARSDFVLTVANREGGAHVDPNLEPAYEALTRKNSLGLYVFEGPPDIAESLTSGRAAEGNAALASVRQVAFEVEQSISAQVGWLLFPVGDPSRPDAFSSLSDERPCPCGSDEPAGRCCLGEAQKAFELGNALADANRPLEASVALRRAVDLEHREACFNLGLVLTHLQNFEGASEAFALGAERGDGAAASNLGVLHQDMGHAEEALAAFEHGARLGSPKACGNAGRSLRAMGRPDAAVVLFERGDQLGDGYSAFMLGNRAREAGRIDEAKAAYRRAISREEPQAVYNLALLERDTGNSREAIELMRQAEASSDPSVAMAATMALGNMSSPGDPT